MIPIIKWELLQRRTSLFWWCFTTVVLIALLMLVYPSIREQADELNAVLNQLPESLRSLKTGDSSVDITSPRGYLHSQLYYSTLPLVLGIFTITLGKSLGSKDEQEHTLELLLARPVSRSKLLFAKAFSGILMISILGTVTAVATAILAMMVGLDIDMSNLLLTSMWTTLLVTSFGVVAFSLSSAHQKLRHLSVPLAIFIGFGGYLLTSLNGMTKWLDIPSKLLPYYYFDPNSLLIGEVSKGLAIYIAGIFVVGGLLAWQGFKARDLD